MDELYDQIRADVETLIAKGRALAADGLTMGEFFTLSRMATKVLVKIIKTVDASTADKKELALFCLDKFTLAVLEAWDIPRIGPWLEGKLDDALHAGTMAMAAVAIDAIVAYWNAEGWPETVSLTG